MKLIPRFLFKCSALLIVPVAANAAGTYYTGSYQSPQQSRYSQQSYAQRSRTTSYSQQNGTNSYGRSQYASSPYANARAAQNVRQVNVSQGQMTQPKQGQVAANQNAKNGFTLGAGLSRQTSMWQFEMAKSGSMLHYDNVDWNVFDVNAAYDFNLGNTSVRLGAGFKYGMQAGESTMVDDDITNGGYFVSEWSDGDNCLRQDAEGNCLEYAFLGNQTGHALSIGTSKDGSMMEFNGGIGLVDFLKWGNVKITPSIGWRHLTYKLETSKNYGLSVDTFDGSGGCVTVPGSDELQCDPVLIFVDSAGNQLQLATRNENGVIEVPSGAYDEVDVSGTFYWEQPGVSHSYEVEWSGPYFALEMLYDINVNNAVNAYVELGLPSYTATGDQPYRFDWQHPKSVEDSAGIGSAFHLGLGANWTTAITDSVALSLGVTYDYYTVSDADAETYLSESYYMGEYDVRLKAWEDAGYTESDMLNGVKDAAGAWIEKPDAIALNIVELQQECPGWVCKDEGEIESFFKSLGVRVGLKARF